MRENVKSTICISLFILFASGCTQTVVNPTETSTHTATIIPTSTPYPEPTVTFVFTPQSTQKAIGGTVSPKNKEDLVESFPSPANNFVAKVLHSWYWSTVEDGNVFYLNKYVLLLENINTFESWVIDEVENESMQPILPWPYLWADNEKTLYFTYKSLFREGCFSPDITNGENLFKYDLDTKKTTKLVPFSNMWVSLSPTYNSVATFSKTIFSSRERMELPIISIVNVLSGEIISANVLNINSNLDTYFLYYTDIIWSESGDLLTYIVRDDLCFNDLTVGGSTLVLVNANSLKQEILFQEVELNLKPLDWKGDEIIVLQELDNEKIWQYNLTTDELYQVDQ